MATPRSGSPDPSAQAISSSQLDRVLRVIEEAPAAAVGERFFRLLVRQMAVALEVRFAFVGQLQAPGQSRILDMWTGAAYDHEGAKLPLDGPFESLLTQGTTFVSGTFAESFPEASWISRIGATSCAAVALYANDGVPLGYLGVLHDDDLPEPSTTLAVLRIFAVRAAAEMERSILERELKISEERYRRLVEGSLDIIIRTRVGEGGSGVEYVNPAAERILGYAPQEFYNNPDLLLEIIDPADLADGREILAGKHFNQSKTRKWIHRDGHTVWLDTRMVPVYNEQRTLVALEGIARDVTARVRAEEALEESRALQGSIIGAIPDVLFRAVLKSSDVHLLTHSGGHDGTEPEQRPLHEIMPLRAAQECKRAIRRAQTSGSRHAFRYEVSAEPEPHVFEVRLVPAGAGSVIGIIRDITGEELLKAVTGDRAKRDDLEGKVEQQMFQRNPYGLSFREFTVLHLVARGSSDKEIANQLGISLFTVNKHVASIRGKFGVTSRTEASVRAIQEGLISL